MQPFLYQIAQLFATEYRESLVDTCFVFPNKRCSTFFTAYLKDLLPEASFLPEMTDIDSLVMSMTRSVIMPRIEQLFMLFNCYTRLRREAFPDDENEQSLNFDTFLTWGEMVLNDFNDIDRYLVDTTQIFRNIRYFKEISANFLTEEQIEIVNRYWRDEITFDPDAPMWRHVEHGDKNIDTVRSFFSLWVILDKLYRDFGNRLNELSMTYNGAAYRRAVELIKDINPAEIMPFRKYVFVGFNVLSATEEKLFSAFRDAGIADFYWDYASPAFNSDDNIDNQFHNPASEFVGRYVKQFPTTGVKLPDEGITSFPKIKIIGVPSTIGQVKKASVILDELITDNPGDFTPVKARRTAVVLPDETLCVPLVNSLSPKVTDINITMGYPMKNSPVASLMGNIIKLQSRCRVISGETAYYFEDLIALLSHPVLRSVYPQKCEEIISVINRDSIFNFKRSALIEVFPDLEPFLIVSGENPKALETIAVMLDALKKISEGDGLSHAFVVSYIRSLDTLRKYVNQYGLTLAHDTIFHLLQRLAGGEAVHFAGEPLEGIQIMGLLETRALDFDNLIMLSMNEKIFPRSTTPRSFIPMEMRAAYGLSTTDHQESIFAYYFYRLLTRCNRVYLIYDTRGGNRSAEMSRYLYQLLYAFPDLNPEIEMTGYKMASSAKREIIVNKTDSIMEKLELFRTNGSDRYLSPSSINTFINCPLQFYLKNVGGYGTDDQLVDYVDDSLFGTIVHYVLEKLYISESNKGTSIFDARRLNVMCQTQKLEIEHLVVCAFKETYLKQDSKKFPSGGFHTTDLPGELELLANMIIKYVDRILRTEANWKAVESFDFKYGEKRIMGYVKFTDRLSLNIKGYIDRVDYVKLESDSTPILRFIDYKTGNEPVEISSVADMFDVTKKSRAKGLLQLMIYCNAYASIKNSDKPVMPLIYNFNHMLSNGLDFMNCDKQPIIDYHSINGEFIEQFEKVMLDLFDPAIPFTQAVNRKKACVYCDFKGICDSNEKEFD